jgi:AcrR family transcriptional regulator
MDGGGLSATEDTQAEAKPRERNARGEGDRLRTALMDAAGELLVEGHTAESLSIRGITARARVTPTALYLHFSDKQELLVALVARSFGELRDALAAAEAAHDGDPRAQLRAIAIAYVEFALERPQLYRVLFGTYIPGSKIMPPGGAPDDPDPGLQTFELLTSAVTRCLTDDRDPFEVSIHLWTALHGFVTLLPVMPSFPWPSVDRFAEEIGAAHVGLA